MSRLPAVAAEPGPYSGSVIVLHGTWSAESRLCLWAEDADSRTGPRARTRVRAHPFACDAERLRGLIADAGCSQGESAALTLLLPSAPSAPLPSPELGRSAGRAAPRLLPWCVPVLALPPEAALDLLLAFDRTLERPQERPVQLSLDATGAHRFLREDAALLSHSGFGVLVPPWWHQPQARLGLRPRGGRDLGTSGLPPTSVWGEIIRARRRAAPDPPRPAVRRLGVRAGCRELRPRPLHQPR